MVSLISDKHIQVHIHVTTITYTDYITYIPTLHTQIQIKI